MNSSKRKPVDATLHKVKLASVQRMVNKASELQRAGTLKIIDASSKRPMAKQIRVKAK